MNSLNNSDNIKNLNKHKEHRIHFYTFLHFLGLHLLTLLHCPSLYDSQNLFTKRLNHHRRAANSDLHSGSFWFKISNRFLAFSLMKSEVRHSPRFSFSRIQATRCFSICTKMLSTDHNSFTSPETLLAADLCHSLFLIMLSTVEHGRLNFLVMLLACAHSSLCSMICIFVCISVKLLDLLLLLGITLLSVFLLGHVYETNFSTGFRLLFRQKKLVCCFP